MLIGCGFDVYIYIDMVNEVFIMNAAWTIVKTPYAFKFSKISF